MIRALAVAVALLPALALAEVAVPDGYRMDHYRAPVPSELPGGTVVGPEEAHALWEAGDTVFIDVLPRPPKPAKLPEGTIWHEQPRDSIPGAMWLPNTGYGALADVTETYFRDGLAEATGGDMGQPVLFFCLQDCWMSWNAAKRALGMGYEAVYWLPEGTDGWSFYDFPTEEITPREPQPR